MEPTIIHISSGQGPRECQWVAHRLMQTYHREALAAGLRCDVLEELDEKAHSFYLAVRGENVDAFLQDRLGTILWVGQSPFRPHHKRKNWYVSALVLPNVEQDTLLRKEDIAWQTL